ncbi:MAG: hypothetical protein ACR652_15095 [Methylocystis sp.]|uniref:hypothetical protein n=1 Tax=Methylocystis sp. TaxID=1911079 RepID=UPI003DA25772
MNPLKIPNREAAPVLMTIDEARSALRIGKQQFADMRRLGLIETVSFGRSVRVVAASVHTLPERLSSKNGGKAA